MKTFKYPSSFNQYFPEAESLLPGYEEQRDELNERFDRIVSSHEDVGTLLRESGQPPSDPYTIALEQLLADCNSDLLPYIHAFTRNLPPQFRSIHLRYLENPRIEALAFKDGSDYFIGLSEGTLLWTQAAYLHLFRMPDFVPEVAGAGEDGDPTALRRGLADMTVKTERRTGGRTVERIVIDRTPPKSRTRFALAFSYAYMARVFIVHHEVAHILGGHLDGHDAAGLSEPLSEFPEESVPALNARRIREMTADFFAAVLSIPQIDAAAKGELPFDTILPKASAFFHWSVAISVLFRVLAQRYRTDNFDDWSDYPWTNGSAPSISISAGFAPIAKASPIVMSSPRR